jgi:hypothetical protein
MGTSPNNRDDKGVPPKSSTVILLLLTMGDTTWRMFVPIIGLMGLGLWIDQQFHTKPWIMIIGMAAGVYLAAMLVKRQFKRVNNK